MEQNLPGLGPDGGWRATTVIRVVGISYRQLDHWTRNGLVHASVQEGTGSGTVRIYAFTDVLRLRTIKALLDAGMSLQRIRRALDHIDATGVALESLTLVADASSVYAVDDAARVIDLLREGQGVFAVMIEPLSRALRSDLAGHPVETIDEVTAIRAAS